MSEQQRLHLSTLMDGEIESPVTHTTVSALESSPDLEATWERYHLIGTAMRSEPMRKEYRKIAALVSARIADEPIPLARAAVRRRKSPRRGTFVGAALAASAAFLAVFAVPQFFESDPDVTPRNRQLASSPPEQLPYPGHTRRWHLDEPALENKLDQFLVNHQEQSPGSAMTGFLPYATVVGYETRQ